jgi:hypothetical protein
MMQSVFPKEVVDGGKQVAIVTHAPHMDRVLHIMQSHPYLPDGSIPYVAPLPTPEAGRREFSNMEVRGMLFYVYLQQDASEEPHPYQVVS